MKDDELKAFVRAVTPAQRAENHVRTLSDAGLGCLWFILALAVMFCLPGLMGLIERLGH